MSRNNTPTVSPNQPYIATTQIDSPYASNLHTNYTPTESEILEIKQLLTEPLKRLSSLDAEIERVQSILDELHREHRALSDEIEAHRALISPIRQLPLDVLEEIFVHCLPKGRNAVMSAQEAPILLGRICSAWRSIALSTPRLWSSLHIPTPTQITETGQDPAQLDPTFIAKVERRCEAAREWISRSGESPISISVCTPRHSYPYDLQPSNMNTFEIAITQILASSHRWKNVDFRATEDSFTRLQQLTEDDVPLLESLVIASGPLTHAWDPLASDFGGRWTECSGLLSARKLWKLSLSYLREDLLSLPVRWSQLTHLNLDLDIFGGTSRGLRYSDVIKVLTRCPLLVSCGLRLGGTSFDVVLQPDHEVPLAEYILSLPLLENLHLNLSGRRDECHLKHLDLPRLCHLEIKFPKTSNISRPSWVDFLSRNGGSVKHLSIDIHSLTRDELFGFLESVPLLIHLHISDHSSSLSVVDDEVIDRLTPSGENSDCLCPMLEEFECNGNHCASFSEAQLLSLVQKRSESEKVGVLKRVDATFDRREPKNFDEFLDSLTGTGLKVSRRNWTGAVIHPESNNTKLSTVVHIKYAADSWPLRLDSFSPWDGQDLDRTPGSTDLDSDY
ncbi:uncharacterized protein LACBIDRAFT_321380 [Laccaria bicolor S238N-H82]|uniref:Predicted protein n=1 Tax=Laccaria bicolor (strain S238N-H82 / ATCC MYA-4686) TaxID=486041 RepID=B0CQ01_LACBS|nr:uncharacterized protein LACBIDRAFT_321380 [Laccaria bicolor S238N-H82]EDR15504.1 predicted protein [Laccaria bicolor S238N-H82]|eukprot:XP_001873712.1 predicted protein [Laccaria bicolor S238N-H82]